MERAQEAGMLWFVRNIGQCQLRSSHPNCCLAELLHFIVSVIVPHFLKFQMPTSHVSLLTLQGTAIEFWKVTKAMNVTFDISRFPFIKFEDR